MPRLHNPSSPSVSPAPGAGRSAAASDTAWRIYIFSDSGNTLWEQAIVAKDEKDAQRKALPLVRKMLPKFDDAEDWVVEQDLGAAKHAAVFHSPAVEKAINQVSALMIRWLAQNGSKVGPWTTKVFTIGDLADPAKAAKRKTDAFGKKSPLAGIPHFYVGITGVANPANDLGVNPGFVGASVRFLISVDGKTILGDDGKPFILPKAIEKWGKFVLDAEAKEIAFRQRQKKFDQDTAQQKKFDQHTTRIPEQSPSISRRGPNDLDETIRSALGGLNIGPGGRIRNVRFVSQSDFPHWEAEPTNRQRLDHYVGSGYDPGEDDDPEGWDEDGWDEEYVTPILRIVRQKLEAALGKGVVTLDIDEKGWLLVYPTTETKKKYKRAADLTQKQKDRVANPDTGKKTAAEFPNPFNGMDPDQEMNDRELTRALRQDLAGELEAIHLYEAHADATDNPLVQEVLQDIANEERVHAGELQHLLTILLPDEAKLLQEGASEVDDKVSKKAVNRVASRYVGKMAAIVGTDTAEIIALAPEMLASPHRASRPGHGRARWGRVSHRG